MPTTLADIRTALETLFRAELTDVQVSAYALSSPTPPCVMVGGPDDEAGISYHGNGAAMSGGTIRWKIPVTVYAGTPTDIGAQKLLDTFIDPTGARSIPAIVKADRTLGEVVQDAVVTHCTGYRYYQPLGANALYLAATFTVQIQASAKES